MKIIRPVPVTTTATLTRASTGTYWDKNGVLQTAVANALRITYDPTDLTQAPYALIETSITNLLLQSQTVASSAWTSTGVTISPNSLTAPDGTTTGDTVTSPGFSISYLSQPVTLPLNAVYTYSTFFKSISGRGKVFFEVQIAGSYSYPAFNLTTGTASSPVGSASIQNVGNGWYRCSVTFTTGSSGANAVTATFFDNVGLTTSGFSYGVWGAQLETGTISSYVATTTAQVTRAADVISGSGLLYSNIVENDYPEWSATTVYPIGTRCIRASLHTVYESVVGNAGSTIITGTSGAAYNFLLPSHTLAIGDAVVITAGTPPANLALNTVYYVRSVPDANNFTVTATKGSTTAINATATVNVTVTASGSSNYNMNPATDTLHWITVGATNKWSMFDQSVTSQTSGTGEVVVAVVLGKRVDSAIGLNISAGKAQLSMVDSSGTLSYSSSSSLVASSGVQDWYSFFYEPIIRSTDYTVTTIPVGASSGGVLVSRVSDATGTAGIGGLVLGLSKDVGVTASSAKVGITDYSVKAQDDFGNYTITPRAFNKTADFTFYLDSTDVDTLENLLSSYRATPVVYIGSNTDAGQDQYNAATVYGFYKEFSIEIAYKSTSICTLSVQGLT